MKPFVKILFALAVGIGLFACAKEYDDSELLSRVDELSHQVSELARQVNDMNLTVVGMKETLDQWKAGGYITGIDNSIEGQHTITFLGGKTVVLYDGQQGEVGSAPEISIKQEEDGEFYWYVGDKKLAPASYLPTFDVNDKGEIIVTVNGEKTNLGVVHGFQDIRPTDNGTVLFVIDEETSFEIPLAKAFKLVIENPNRQVQAGEEVSFAYTVENSNSSTQVDAFAGGAYKVSVSADKVLVKVPTPAADGQVLVWAQNGEGLFSMVKLSFTVGEVEPEIEVVSSTEDLEAIPGSSADPVEVNLVSNVEVELEKPGVEWVSAVLTKSAYKLTLTFQPNDSGEPRETDLRILRTDTKAPVQTLHLVQLPAGVAVERVWGKFSTADASWNAYLEGFNTNSDRNVTMDDKYIYIAEAKPGVKNIWALDIKDGSVHGKLPAGTIENVGTFPVCCPRVMNLGVEPVLVVSNMTENAGSTSTPLYLYVYENGVEQDPTPVQLQYGSGRMGDTFSFWGANATNSSDGQGLTKGMLYFDNTDGDGVRIWKTTWTKGSLPKTAAVQVRYGFDNGSKAVGAFWTYPGYKDAGIWGGRGSSDSPVKSVYGGVKDGAPNLWGAAGDQLSNTECTPIASGYYNNVTCYQFFTFHGKRYIAYAKQVGSKDGRLIILEGAETDEWNTIIDTRKITYQAAIQEDKENADEYNESPMASGHSGMDLCIREVDGGINIVVLKQNVGLSLFRLSCK